MKKNKTTDEHDQMHLCTIEVYKQNVFSWLLLSDLDQSEASRAVYVYTNAVLMRV